LNSSAYLWQIHNGRYEFAKGMQTTLFKIGIGLVLFLPAFFVSGHGTGQSLERAVGDYVVDVGYDSFEPRALESIRFDFQIFLSESREPAPFTDTWVRVMEGDNLLFAGFLAKPIFGLTGMSYAFPAGGIYEVTVRFQNDDTTVAEASFPFPVAEKSKNPDFQKKFSLGYS
jgi:hypothetical protein